jgi:hypothetical protein
VITSSPSISLSNDLDKLKSEIKSEPNISILPINKDVQLTDYNNSNLRLISHSNGIAVTTTSIGQTVGNLVSSNLQSIDSALTFKNDQSKPTESNPNSSIVLSHVPTLSAYQEHEISSHLSVQKEQTQLDHLIDKCSNLPQKKSDSFLNLPSPVEENKTKHLINPFTGHMELMMSEDDEEEMISNNTPILPNTVQATKLIECKDNPSDTDSGLGKLTNDGSSQSSSEISPIEAGSTITVNELLMKSNEMINCLQRPDSSKIVPLAQTKTVAFIPTLLDQEPSVQPLNARVPSLACDLISESADSLLSENDRIVNVNDMLTGSIGKELTPELSANSHSLVEASFVDGLLNYASLDKLTQHMRTASSSLVEGEICTLISDSACSESFEMMVDEPSKVLNDVFNSEPQTNMISTLSSNVIEFQSHSLNCEATNSKLVTCVDSQVESEQMLVDTPDLEEMQVTVQCVGKQETVTCTDDVVVIATTASDLLNEHTDESSVNHASGSELCLAALQPIADTMTDAEMVNVEPAGENAEPMESCGESSSVSSAQLQSVASGDHNYTNLKRNCATNYTKIGTNVKNVNI